MLILLRVDVPDERRQRYLRPRHLHIDVPTMSEAVRVQVSLADALGSGVSTAIELYEECWSCDICGERRE